MTRAWSLCGVWEAAAGRLPTRGGFPWENSESSFHAMFDSMKQLPQFIKLLTNLRKTLSDRGILLVVCFLSFAFRVSTFFGCFAFW